MRKLALSDEILLSIEKPARYIGNEVNSVMKDRDSVQVRFAMCFPDVYEIGMSHLGIQILYDMFNKREDTWCERVYSPWTDLDRVLREKQIPLFALESQDPVKEFDFLGITIQYEMCYTNILQILDLSRIPLMAADRMEEGHDWECPLVIGGGPAPTIRSRWQSFLICSISERARPCMTRCWISTRPAGRKAAADGSFCTGQPGFQVSMSRRSMR